MLTYKFAVVLILVAVPTMVLAEDLTFVARTQFQKPADASFEIRDKQTTWNPERTALIVCDVWDYHHCLNAVRRLEEFAPRMNELVKFARAKGVTIIHSPSDCMPAYKDHPARKRALNAAGTSEQPARIKSWCSRIPAEEKGTYPIDQSDGGEDDDPKEHAEWAAKLKALGRNPGMPWKAQSPLIEIDGGNDFISDEGDVVWKILQSRKIDNVLMVGVHVNMCVLGRPFGLRQMVRNGKNAVLVRDMTDAMYNPARWPFVDHFTGTDLVISHIERHVCATTTSDQFLGGKPFRSKYDTRGQSHVSFPNLALNADLLRKSWQAVAAPNSWKMLRVEAAPVAWYRCNLWVSEDFASAPIRLGVEGDKASAWLNGKPLKAETTNRATAFAISKSIVHLDDANLLVIRLADGEFLAPPTIAGKTSLTMRGRWEVRIGDDPTWSDIPLPAKFGTSPDIVFEP